MSATWFPILWSRLDKEIRECQETGPFVVVSIPWRMIAPYEGNAQANHRQSLARLAERGGLNVNEALAVLDGRRWTDGFMPVASANYELARRVQAYLATANETGAGK